MGCRALCQAAASGAMGCGRSDGAVAPGVASKRVAATQRRQGFLGHGTAIEPAHEEASKHRVENHFGTLNVTCTCTECHKTYASEVLSAPISWRGHEEHWVVEQNGCDSCTWVATVCHGCNKVAPLQGAAPYAARMVELQCCACDVGEVQYERARWCNWW